MGHRMAVSHYITDEIFGIASSVEGKLNPFYNYGAASVAGPGWTLGTFLGALLGTALPDRLGRALGVALYGMFIAIIIPPAKKSRSAARTMSQFTKMVIVYSSLSFDHRR